MLDVCSQVCSLFYLPFPLLQIGLMGSVLLSQELQGRDLGVLDFIAFLFFEVLDVFDHGKYSNIKHQQKKTTLNPALFPNSQ